MEIVKTKEACMASAWPCTTDSWYEYKGLELYESARQVRTDICLACDCHLA